jgi:hypothetical protein
MLIGRGERGLRGGVGVAWLREVSHAQVSLIHIIQAEAMIMFETKDSLHKPVWEEFHQ